MGVCHRRPAGAGHGWCRILTRGRPGNLRAAAATLRSPLVHFFERRNGGLMAVAARAESPVRDGPAAADSAGPASRRLRAPPRAYLLCGALIVTFFAADVVLPRGATAAIGYCLVPVVAGGSPRRAFLVGMTVLCTALTWVGFLVEQPGVTPWISVFERVMVTGVVWLALLLVLRRTAVIAAMGEHARALRVAARELERSNAELERFASVVAHDLRGPLNSIGLHAELLGQAAPARGGGSADGEDEAVRRECGEAIRSEIARLDGLIRRLLAYGRVGAGEVYLAPCDCAATLAEVRRVLQADLERTGGQITCGPLPVVRADPTLMTELFQNLVENSLKYRGPDAPRVHVAAERGGGGWTFTVRDNGIGVPPAQAGRIFDPFRQAPEARARGKGVGLGLATCRRIVERHGGRIYVEPRPGPGATFVFTIPQPEA